MRRYGCGVVIAVLVTCIFIGQTHAQRANRPIELQCTGSVKSIQPLFQVTTDKDEIWIFEFSQNIIPNEDIHITGEAEPGWLQSGMAVRLTAKINTKKGRFIDPITELEVIASRPEIEPGLIDENKPKDTDDLFPAGDKKPAKKPKATKLPEEMTATLVGEIGSFKEGEIAIKVPGFKVVKGELAEKCKISVDIANPAMIRVGDKVTVVGEYFEAYAPNGGAPGRGFIKKIDVTANEKFEPAKPVKRGQKPYDNAKPGEEGKDAKSDGKPDEKGAAKPEPGKAAAGKPAAGKPEAGKAPLDPKKKP